MKKLLLLLTIFLLISCDGIDSKDGIVEAVLKVETTHLKRYNKLLQLTKYNKDTVISNYIIKVKDTLKSDALTAKGIIEGRSGIIIGEMKNSKNKINEYIKLCE